MFDTGFAMLFRAVGRIRVQLERADPDFRNVLAEELYCLRQLGDQYIDHWVSLDEQIDELFDMYELPNPVMVGSLATLPSTLTPAPSHSIPLPAPESLRISAPWSQSHVSAQHGLDDEVSLLDIDDHNPVEDWQPFAFAEHDEALPAFRQGMGYYDLLMFEEASRSLQTVVDQNDHPIARIYLAAAHAARARYDQALEHVLHVRSRSTHRVVICATYEVEAQIRLAMDDVPSAIQCLQEIIHVMPDYQDVWYNLGICLAQQGEYEAAGNALRRVVADNASDVLAMTALIRVELLQDHVDEAASVCDLGLAQFPRHVHLLYAKSHVLDRQGRVQESIDLVRQIAVQSPTSSWAWSRLAWLLLREHRADDAIAALKKHLTLCPKDPQTMLQLGISYFVQGRMEQAEEILNRSLELHQDATIIWIALGRISARRGEMGKAYARFLRAMRDTRKPVKRLALYYYGISLAEQRQWTESEKYLKAAGHLGSKNAAILMALAHVAEEQGRRLEADKLRSRARQAQPD